MPSRIAILAPIHSLDLKDVLPGLPVGDPGFPKGMGGYCTVSLVKERLKRGLPTDIITLDPTAPEPIMRWADGLVRLWVVRRRASQALRDGCRREVQGLQQALRESQPDVCHAHWTHEYGLAAVTQQDYPVVLTVHDHARNCLRWLGPKFLPLFLITQYVLRHARHITTVSPHVAEYLEQKLGRRIPVIPNLLPETAWQLGAEKFNRSPEIPLSGAEGPSGKRVMICSAINWSRLKNTRRALLAIQTARQQCREKGIELQYTLIGPGLEIGGPAERWGRAHAGVEGILFRGRVSYEESLRLIARSDLLLHPSHEEAMPGPVAEAMLMGTPVLAAQEAGGSRWLLDGGRCGCLFSGMSARDMASAIVSMATQLPPGMTADARARISQLCNPEAILAGYARMYQVALNSKGVEGIP